MQGADLSKFITIQHLDGSETHLTTADLPLSLGSDQGAHLHVPGYEPILAYIGESEGHIFIQPTGKNTLPLFHNDYQILQSTWLKSEDILQAGETNILYKVVGDKVIFTIMKSEKNSLPKPLRPPQAPPPDTNEISPKIPVTVAETPSPGKRGWLIKGALTGIFLVLGLAVCFVLLARPLEVTLHPTPDNVTITGFPPALKIGARYFCFPGTYTITATKKGYHPFKHSQPITNRQNNKISASLQKLPGILKLNLTPPNGVAVYSQGTLLGTTPPNRLTTPPGRHTLTLKKEMYQTVTKEVDILGEEKVQELEAVLPPDWATIIITSQPEDVTVAIDNKQYGNTPLTIDLLSGEHKISLTKDTYAKKDAAIQVTAEKTATHSFTLQLLPARLQLTSKPSQAAVSIGNEYKGTTPLTFSLPAGKHHQILLSKPGFASTDTKILLAPDEERQLDVLLEQQFGSVYVNIDPPHATLKINGKKYNNNQGKFTLPVASHIFEVSATGYKPATRTVLPNTGFGQQVTVSLPLLKTEAVKSSNNTESQSLLTSSEGHKLIFVQPLSFLMGAPRREPGRRSNERERRVDMQRAFYLAEKTVTNRQYRLFNKKHSSQNFAGHTLDSEEQPVVNISWEDAVRYLNWLSKRDGLKPFYIAKGNSFIPDLPLTNGYRMPSEAEWAYCARRLGNSKQLRFPWKGSFPPQIVTGNFADESARTFLPNSLIGYNDRFPVSSPVGSFPANRGGFYDMGSNISEWCHDFYTPYSGSLAKQVDPLGPETGRHRVIRGASWRDASVTELRLSYRAYHLQARDNVGFRIARYK